MKELVVYTKQELANSLKEFIKFSNLDKLIYTGYHWGILRIVPNIELKITKVYYYGIYSLNIDPLTNTITDPLTGQAY